MKIEAGMVAVITGGGGGIALGVAELLASKGCHIALVDISQTALDENKAKLVDLGTTISTHVVDVTDRVQMEALAKDVVERHGKVNILHNNAGITLQKNFENHSIEDWERMLGINVWGVIYGTQFFLPALKQAAANEGAHILNMSSLAGFVGMPNQSSYGATKAAVKAISQSLYSELYHYGIGVTSVHPGAIKTKMILATLDESDDVKQATKNYKLVEKMGNTVEYAAEKIVNAVEKNHQRIRIGKDAIITDILSRYVPVGFVKLMKKVADKLRRERVASNATSD